MVWALLTSLLSAATVTTQVTGESLTFESFAETYGKEYSSEEFAIRKEVFNTNVAKIEEINASGEVNHVLAVNRFADLTTEEWKELHGLSTNLGQREAFLRSSPIPRDTFVESDIELPSSVDWRLKDVVTGVKNQGQCGSCWSFSTTGALEGAFAIAQGKLVSMSEQMFVDCDKVDTGCYGGWMDNAFVFAARNGVCKESAYRYTAKCGSCHPCSDFVFGPGKISKYVDIPQNNIKAMKQAVTKQPIAIAIEADQFVFQFYSKGVITSGCGSSLDHGVLIVGYGSDGAKGEYWIIKNSWSASWGDNGYVKIGINTENGGSGSCGVLASGSYPVLA